MEGKYKGRKGWKRARPYTHWRGKILGGFSFHEEKKKMSELVVKKELIIVTPTD